MPIAPDGRSYSFADILGPEPLFGGAFNRKGSREILILQWDALISFIRSTNPTDLHQMASRLPEIRGMAFDMMGTVSSVWDQERPRDAPKPAARRPSAPPTAEDLS